VDASHPQFRDHIRVVNETLEALHMTERTVLQVFNKIDLLEDVGIIREFETEYPGAIFVSAHRGINITQLLQTMQRVVDEGMRTLHLLVPFSAMGLITQLYDAGEVTHRDDTEHGIDLTINLPREEWNRFSATCAAYVQDPAVA